MNSGRPIVPPRIAVLGGGISGLASAFWLTRLIPNASITLYEKQGRVGGLIGSKVVQGRLIETGPLAFPLSAPATAELLDRCGLAGLCETARQSVGLGLWNGKRVAPFSRTVAKVLQARLLSPWCLVRLLAEPFIPRGKAADESVRDFFRRRTGDEFMEAIMEPMSSGILAGDPSVMSMSANYPMLFGLERKWGSLAKGLWKKARRSNPDGPSKLPGVPKLVAGFTGNQTVVDEIAKELSRRGVRIRLSASISEIRKTASDKPGTDKPGTDQIALRFAGHSESEIFDGVVSCLPAYALARVYPEGRAEVKQFLNGIPFTSVALAYLSYRKKDFANCFRGEGCLIQGRTGVGILSMFLPSRMFTGRCPTDEEMVRIMIGGERFKVAVSLEEDEIRSLVTHAVSRILAPSGSPNDFTCIRHQDALPQLLTGHLHSLSETKSILKSDLPGMILAGTSFSGAGIENAVREGKQAAEGLLEELRRLGRFGRR